MSGWDASLGKIKISTQICGLSPGHILGGELETQIDSLSQPSGNVLKWGLQACITGKLKPFLENKKVLTIEKNYNNTKPIRK